MPGVLAAVGVGDAGARVRAAARPLLRRAFQSLDVLEPDRRVALAAVGERAGLVRSDATGVVVAFEGELFASGGVVQGVAAAVRLLRAYLESGSAIVPPDGSFTAAIWDPRTRELMLVTDHAGTRPLYVSADGRRVLAASELKALVAAGVSPKLDLTGFAEVAAYEQHLGGRTLLQGVELVRGGRIRTFAAGRRGQERQWFDYRLDPDESARDREVLASFADALDLAVARRVGEDAAFALSGGLDSRCVAIALHNRGWTGPAVTFGARDSEELRLGTSIAHLLGMEHHGLALAPGYLAASAAETVWLTEGQIRALHSHHRALRRLREAHVADGLLIGYAGDIVARWGARAARHGDAAEAALHRAMAQCIGDELAGTVFHPAFAAELEGRARASLAAAFEAEGGDEISRRNQFGFNHVLARKVLPGIQLFADDLAPRDPYLDRDLLEVLRRLPRRLREHGRLQCLYIGTEPQVGGIVSPKDGAAPNAGRLRRSAQVQYRDAARWIDRRFAGSARPGRRRLTAGIGDYASDLRTGGDRLLLTLLDARTADRRQIEPGIVAGMIDETLRGSARWTKTLGVLLTLELFQRQFVDGDGAPDPGLPTESFVTSLAPAADGYAASGALAMPATP